MKRLILFLYFFSLSTFPAQLNAQEQSGQLILSHDPQSRILFELGNISWKYHPGDNPDWARPEFNDSSWQLISPTLRPEDLAADKWSGTGWFRLAIDSDSTLNIVKYGLSGFCFGDIKIYWNGFLVSNSLERKPFSISVEPDKKHLLAIRYKLSNLKEMQQEYGYAGFLIDITDYQKDFDLMLRQRSEQMIFTSLPLAFALLHLILFVFLPTARANLYYALFLIFSAITTYADIEAGYLADYSEAFTFLLVHRFFIPIAILMFLRFVYSVIYDHTPRQFWVFSVLLIAVIVPLMINPETNFHYYIILSLITQFEIVRVIIIAVKNKKDGIYILATGMVILFTFSLYDTLMDLDLLSPINDITNAYYFGSIGLYVAMSVYLGRDFARSNQKIIEQERHAEKLALERKLLEAEDTRKSEELDKARQLQLSMLPQCLNDIPGLDICFHMTPASEVGGDYYDFKYNNDILTVAIGDATGHGMNAGMMVSIIKSLFIADIDQCDLVAFMNKASSTIKQMQLGNMYMAFQLVRIEHKKVQISSAGMPPVYIYRKENNSVEEILLKAMPLGAPVSFPYQVRETSINAGDVILLMSDGFAEQFNAQKEMMDFPIIKEKLSEFSNNTATELIDLLTRYGKEWLSGQKQGDDITFVAIKMH